MLQHVAAKGTNLFVDVLKKLKFAHNDYATINRNRAFAVDKRLIHPVDNLFTPLYTAINIKTIEIGPYHSCNP
jgi:hypothetical protein